MLDQDTRMRTRVGATKAGQEGNVTEVTWGRCDFLTEYWAHTSHIILYEIAMFCSLYNIVMTLKRGSVTDDFFYKLTRNPMKGICQRYSGE